MAVFYGQFKVETFRRQMKENRKIEELILMFATHATSVLRKDPTLTADGKWNVELNSHIVQFVKLLRESLRSISHVSPELTACLDVYAAKLGPSERTTQSDSGHDSSTTSHRDSVPPPSASTMNVNDMSSVNTRCEAISNSCGPSSAGAREVQERMHRTGMFAGFSRSFRNNQVDFCVLGGTDRSESALERQFPHHAFRNPDLVESI
jgi:hypothetical protein